MVYKINTWIQAVPFFMCSNKTSTERLMQSFCEQTFWLDFFLWLPSSLYLVVFIKLMLPEHIKDIEELLMNKKKFMLHFKEAASKVIKLRRYYFSWNLTKYMSKKAYKLRDLLEEGFCLLDSTNFKQEGFRLLDKS